MAAPSIQGTPSATNVTVTADPWTVNIGSPASGERVVIFLRAASTPTFNLPNGWTWLVQNDTSDASDDVTSIIYRDCDGTEGATLSVDLSGTAKGSALAYPICDAATTAPTVSTVLTGTDATVEFNAANWGYTSDALVLAYNGIDGETQLPVVSWPSGYTLGQQTANSGSAGTPATNCVAGCSGRQVTAATTETPGTHTWTNPAANGWTGYAVAIVTTDKNAAVAPTTIARTATTNAPTAEAASSLTLTAVARTAVTNAPSVTAAADVTLSTVARAAATGTPSLSVGVSASFGTSAVTAAVGAPSANADAQASLGTVQGAAAVPAPTVETTATGNRARISWVQFHTPVPSDASVSLDPVRVSAATGTLSVTAAAQVPLAAVARTATMSAPTLSGAASVDLTTVARTATVHAPTIDVTTNVALSTVACSAATATPTVSGSANAGLTTVARAATVPTPGVSAGNSVNIPLGTVTATALTHAPTVDVFTNAATGTVTGTGSTGDPTVTADAEVPLSTVAIAVAIPGVAVLIIPSTAGTGHRHRDPTHAPIADEEQHNAAELVGVGTQATITNVPNSVETY